MKRASKKNNLKRVLPSKLSLVVPARKKNTFLEKKFVKMSILIFALWLLK